MMFWAGKYLCRVINFSPKKKRVEICTLGWSGIVQMTLPDSLSSSPIA